MGDTTIRCLADLADLLGAEALESAIARRLYKDTTCGISFWVIGDKGVGVSGYCEGTDYECPPHTLDWPFTAEAFDAAVEAADKDGCDTWDETHGCEDCGEEIDGERPVNPDCKTCKGEGVVL